MGDCGEDSVDRLAQLLSPAKDRFSFLWMSGSFTPELLCLSA
jgi:hypothetical protein